MTTTFYDHWREVPEGAWRWPNFSPAEIACRGTGKLLINEPALEKLQALRDRLGKPLIVRSAYRSPEHNRAVGGATRSKHLDGAAFDIAMANHDPVAFEAAAREVPEILACHLMAGDADYLLQIVATDVADYERVHRTAMARLPHVAKVRTNFVLRSVIDRAPIEARR